MFLIFIILSLIVSSSDDISRPTDFSDNEIAENESNAYDDNTNSYAFLNTSGGNNSYKIFTVGSHDDLEDVKQIDLLLDIEVSGTEDDEWALQYSDDSGNTWNDLRALTTGNLTRQVLNYSNVQELSDNDWTWNEIRNELQIRVQTVQVGGIDNASIKLYEIYVNVTYDGRGPSIAIVQPQNNANFTSNNITFTYNATDILSGLSNCSLLINDLLNLTNSSVFEGVNSNFNQTFAEGIYNWSIQCFDNASFIINQNTSEIRIFTMDFSPPTIQLESPDNSATYNSSSVVVFSYNVSDIVEISNCSIVINGTVNKTNLTIQRDASQTFTIDFLNGVYSWDVNCSDGSGYENQSESRSFSVDLNLVPQVDSVSVDQDITLNVGATKSVLCNTTVSDADGSGEISEVVATLYHNSHTVNDPDENSTHYTNSSCTETDSQAFTKTYSCGFDMWYFSRDNTWYCNINVTDNQSDSSNSQTSTSVQTLYALNVSPQIIDYGVLYAGNTSLNDVQIMVSNLGNQEIDITLDGYARFDGDGLAMNCTVGDINLSFERYSLSSGTPYNSMSSLTDTPVQLDNFNLTAKNDTFDAEKMTYWKIRVPKPKKGVCGGYVTFSAVIS
ncbi:Ig-like domain-containing protein [Bacteroidota bacterium]